ncbi:hypothetical protein EJ419_05505 [Alloscardovia theropitheci]|uniref:Uncharacterized protein n=1 Tax=Alloscardovia theropitheci TaxID=2496842 RepID=A0A4R0QXF5_9BIFI|nr:hypothetical protein [Alloscardovia theropitheci]TCD54111.1 hypothetical protein EJ419_05505 [Alloscardovia theropitheci]
MYGSHPTPHTPAETASTPLPEEVSSQGASTPPPRVLTRKELKALQAQALRDLISQDMGLTPPEENPPTTGRLHLLTRFLQTKHRDTVSDDWRTESVTSPEVTPAPSIPHVTSGASSQVVVDSPDTGEEEDSFNELSDYFTHSDPLPQTPPIDTTDIPVVDTEQTTQIAPRIHPVVESESIPENNPMGNGSPVFADDLPAPTAIVSSGEGETTSGHDDHTSVDSPGMYPVSLPLVYAPLPSPTGHPHRRPSVKQLLVVLLPVLILGLCGMVALPVYMSHVHSSCRTSWQAYKTAYDRYARVYEDGMRVLSSTHHDMVDNPQTLTVLQGVLTRTPRVMTPSCDVSPTSLHTAWESTRVYDSEATRLSTQAKKITTHINAVTTSVESKKILTAKTTLETTIREAKNLLASSNGTVADNVTRDKLATLISESEKTVHAKKPTVKDMTAMQSRLSDAMNAVTHSVQAKADAERKAQEEADRKAQAPAHQQYSPSVPTPRSTPRSTPRTTPRRNNNGGSSGGGGGGNSWSVPQDQGDAYLPGQL